VDPSKSCRSGTNGLAYLSKARVNPAALLPAVTPVLSALVDREAWDRDVADLVLRALPPVPARVLEVGCGEGRLARSMSAAGYRVVAIDPDAPEGPLFKRVTIEEFVASDPFEAAVATLSLHHIVDLDAAVAKIAGLIAPGGTFVVVEFASDRLDEATAGWALKHLVPGNEHGWLARRRSEWKAQDGGPDASGFAEYLRRWAASEKFHSAAEMLEVCRRHFDERQFEEWPYLYAELEGVTREQEIAEIEAGRIQAMGLTFVGSARPAP
jgi:SAM-dependent methyltransferase